MGFLSAVTDTLGLTTPDEVTSAQGRANSAMGEQQRKRNEYAKKLAQEATAFRNNLPSYKEQSFMNQEDSAKQGLARDLANVRKSANSRGMLYSGLRAGGEAGALSDFYSGQASERAKINQGAEDTARAMEEKALGIGYGAQQSSQGMQDSLYDRALAERSGRQQALGGLFGALGSGFGLLGAKKGAATRGGYGGPDTGGSAGGLV